ncbi:MAG: methylated-DNA--[protein]-cysteine S-methyltransferase [Sulfuricurvum sp.]
MSDFVATMSSPLGQIVLYANDKALTNLDFLEGEFEESGLKENPNEILDLAKKELALYFRGELKSFSVPLDPQGSTFQKSVWNTLLKIPYGKTISYKDEAISLGKPTAFRAVANANGANPISIIIPCHRVIASSGKLGGYSGGIEKKIYLLNLEKGE